MEWKDMESLVVLCCRQFSRGLRQQEQPPYRRDGQPGRGGGVRPVRTETGPERALAAVPRGQPGRDRPHRGGHGE